MIVIMRDAVMPECCKTCVCSEGYGCGITGTEMTTKEMESRPDWCPLEEVEPCEDAVSRADMLNELDGWIEGFDANCHKESFADMKLVRSSMSKLPSVTPEKVNEQIKKAVVDAIKSADVVVAWDDGTDDYDLADIAIRATKSSVIKSIEDLPSAQPEPDTRLYSDGFDDGYKQAIKDAQPEPRWVPCSERLPEEKDAGILKKLGTEKRSEYVLATVETKGERMTVTACTYDGKWDWKMKYAFPDFKVVAWMPMPEPWKGEQHG